MPCIGSMIETKIAIVVITADDDPERFGFTNFISDNDTARTERKNQSLCFYLLKCRHSKCIRHDVVLAIAIAVVIAVAVAIVIVITGVPFIKSIILSSLMLLLLQLPLLLTTRLLQPPQWLLASYYCPHHRCNRQLLDYLT